MKRVVIISDLHCGNRAGLTPPDFQYADRGTDIRKKFAEVQRIVWDWYTKTLEELQPIDTIISNGDAIDGKGEGTGGTELLELDRGEQARMAAMCIDEAHAKKVYVIFGTPYHTGKDEDHEAEIAGYTRVAKSSNHEWIGAEAVVLDCKHKVGGSIIPHGRFTGPARDALWNALWAEREMQPRANIIIRSHVHYHIYAGTPERLVMTTPALQAWSKYGSKEIVGTNDIGFVSFDIDKGGYQWRSHILDMRFSKARILPA